MFSILYILLFSFISTALPVDDVDFACTSEAVAQTYVKDFHVNVSSFGGLELCDSKVDTKKLLNDFELVEKGEFNDSQDKNIFIRNIVDKSNYYSWLKSMTKSIRRKQDIPTATAYNSFGNFTMQDGWAQLSTLGRVGVLVHEARHTPGYSHYQCDQGPYKGAYMSGCDKSLEQEGSHAVEMEYYSRVVLQGKNFHPVYQTMARLMNTARANFVFNKNPLKQGEILFAISGNQGFIYDGELKALPTLALGDDFLLKRTSAGASLFNGSEAYSLDVYQSFHEPTLIKDDYSYYKMLGIHKIDNLLDLEEFDTDGRRYLVALSNNGDVRTFIFADGNWSKSKNISGASYFVTTTPDGEEGIFVVKQDSSICKLNPQNLSCSSLNLSWPQATISFIKLNNSLFELKNDGNIYKASSNEVVPELQGQFIKQAVKSPVYDQFSL